VAAVEALGGAEGTDTEAPFGGADGTATLPLPVLLMPTDDEDAGLLLSGFFPVPVGFLAALLLLLGEVFSVASISRLLSESIGLHEMEVEAEVPRAVRIVHMCCEQYLL
jgi:hypothetical protein